MKEQKKKQLITALLFVSCFISGYMLFSTSSGNANGLHNFSQADSLILKKFADFNINEQQVRTLTIRVDSNFSRKIYHVRLPYQFSKTQFHADLNKVFHNYDIQTPARVTFPEKDVKIQLLYNETVIRTISLQTDPDLTINRKDVSILVAFDHSPDEELINQLQRLGEPIPMVFKVENPMQANELNKELSRQYSHISFWLQDENGEDILRSNPKAASAKFKQLSAIVPDAKFFQLKAVNQAQEHLPVQTNLTVVDADNTLLLNEAAGKTVFFEKLHKLQTNAAYSMAVIIGNKTTLRWFQEKLPELKKAGIRLILPSQMNF